MASPPAIPSTLQLTVVSVKPVTLAVNCCVPLSAIAAEFGEMVIPGGGGVRTTVIDSLALITAPVFVHAVTTIACVPAAIVSDVNSVPFVDWNFDTLST